MRIVKKFLAFLLAAVMVLSLAACTPGGEIETAPPESGEPSAGSTAGTEPSEEPTEEPQSVSWEYEDGVLTISGEGMVGNYKDGTPPWEKYRSKITTLIIGEGITSIGSKAFTGLENLRDVQGGENVTEVGNNAFNGTKWIEFGGIRAIGSYLLDYGEMSEYFYIGHLDLTEYTHIHDYAFDINDPESRYYGGGIPGIGSLTFSDGVTIGKGAFCNMPDLKSVTFNGDATIRRSAFINCKKLSSLTITGDVILEASAFEGCGFWEITLNSAANIGYFAFRCENLESVTLNGETIIAPQAFGGCSNLQTVTGENIVEIGLEAFDGTPFVDEFEGDILTLGNFIVKANPNLFRVEIPESITGICADAFKGCTNLTKIVGGENVKEVMQNAFDDTPWLEAQKDEFVILGSCLIKYNGAGGDVTIPSNVEGIGNRAFYGSNPISSLTISDNVTNISPYAFDDCDIVDVYYAGTEEEFDATWMSEADIWENPEKMGYGYPYPFDPSTNVHYNSSMPE